MTKPTIDQQIEAVEYAYYDAFDHDKARAEATQAALKTLHWVKRHAPTIKTILGEFEGSTVKPREDE